MFIKDTKDDGQSRHNRVSVGYCCETVADNHVGKIDTKELSVVMVTLGLNLSTVEVQDTQLGGH